MVVIRKQMLLPEPICRTIVFAVHKKVIGVLWFCHFKCIYAWKDTSPYLINLFELTWTYILLAGEIDILGQMIHVRLWYTLFSLNRKLFLVIDFALID